MASAPNQPRDRKAAKAKLKEARAALANNQFEQAEAIALDVKSWNLTYGWFEDNPDKVAAAARALRRRDQLRHRAPREQPSQGVYDVLVQESRQLMAVGQCDEAEAKARQAQRMNVVPSLTADRAETVLHEIAMIEGPPGVARRPDRQCDGAGRRHGSCVRRGSGCRAARSGASARAEPASVVAEREANELLARGDTDAAAAKFAEAERLRAQEQRPAGGEPANPATNVAIVAPAGQCGPGGPEGGRHRGRLRSSRSAAPVRRQRPVRAEPAPAPRTGAPGQPRRAAAGRGQGALRQRQLRRRPADGDGGQGGQVRASTAQADELLAQIALAEQGGALSLYEAALDAVRKGDNGRARALLTEVAAAGAALDEGTMQKVQDLLDEAPAGDDGQGKHGRPPEPAHRARDRRRGARRAEAQRRGRHQDRRGPPAPGDRPRQGDRPLRETRSRRSRRPDIPETVARTMVRRLEVAIELAKKDKVAFDAKMKDKKPARRDRAEAAPHPRGRQGQEGADEGADGQGHRPPTPKGKYAEAEAFAKRRQEIDPNEVAAVILVFKAKTERRYKTETWRTKTAKEEGVVRTLPGGRRGRRSPTPRSSSTGSSSPRTSRT